MRIRLFVTLAILVGMFAAVLPAAASNPPPPTLDWRTPTAVSACPAGKVVINVTHGVTHDADSGFAGHWAFDHYVRSIKVVDIGPGSGSFCAVTRYNGGFTTFAGASPQGTGTVGAGVEGSMRGGYRTVVFTGTLNPTPSKPRHGYIGTFDYGCTPAGICSNLFSWPSTYFTGLSANFDLAWWGWIYTTECNGTWVNAISGSLGDITGVKHQCDDNSGGDNSGGDNSGGDNSGGNNSGGNRR